jgi:hypothetical protein
VSAVLLPDRTNADLEVINLPPVDLDRSDPVVAVADELAPQELA